MFFLDKFFPAFSSTGLLGFIFFAIIILNNLSFPLKNNVKEKIAQPEKNFGQLLKDFTSSTNTPISTPTSKPSSIPILSLTPTPTPTSTPQPISSGIIPDKKVLLLIFNPIIESRNNQKLTTLLNWNNPDKLSQDYINDIKEISHGIVQYKITQRQEENTISPLIDGFQYTDETFLDCWNNHSTCHQPEGLDYQRLLNQYGVCDKVNRGEIDELWLMGGPWFGYWEAVMAGPGTFNTNAPPLTNTDCQKKLHIMGFNYERGVPEMLEDLGHRTEGTISYIYNEDPRWSHKTETTWGKFVASCGWMHYPPNGTTDYDWSNQNVVNSSCDDWLNYPNLSGSTQAFNCSRWGCTGYQFIKWWFTHLPHIEGITDGKFNNWWKYVVE